MPSSSDWTCVACSIVVIGLLVLAGIGQAMKDAEAKAAKKQKGKRDEGRPWSESYRIENNAGLLPGEKMFFGKVVGVTFENEDGGSRQAVLAAAVPGEWLRLQRDPGNPVDEDAVLVLRQNGQILGHLSAELAEGGDSPGGISKQLKRGQKFRVRLMQITGGTGDKPTLGANIRISYYADRRDTGEPDPVYQRPTGPAPARPQLPRLDRDEAATPYQLLDAEPPPPPESPPAEPALTPPPLPPAANPTPAPVVLLRPERSEPPPPASWWSAVLVLTVWIAWGVLFFAVIWMHGLFWRMIWGP